MKPALRPLALCLCLLLGAITAAASEPVRFRRLDGSELRGHEINAEVTRQMEKERVTGLAVALIQYGIPFHVRTYGSRSLEEKLPLQQDTIMYAASLTKMTFAYMVMQLVDEKKIDLDRPIATYLTKPLPEYPKYADLAGDARWESLTPRMLLNHTPGFPNFRFLNPDQKLDFKFDPGSRYAYSGEGYNLLQFVLEEGLGLDVGLEMQRRVFDRFGMKRTSMTWRDDFAANVAHGYALDGKLEKHHARKNARAAGSMDTTITDYANFLADYMRGKGISPEARREMLRPQVAITSAHQFPTLDTATNPENEKIGLAAGLGMVLFQSADGPAFFKGGHDDWTGNMAICVESKKQCILLMSNSVRAEIIYPALVRSLFGETRLPWDWEYNPTVAAPTPSPIPTSSR